jgi:hypothetical protein
MDDDDPARTLTTGSAADDRLLREVAAAPSIPLPSDIATYVFLELGTVIDGAFRIEARLGAGGMGVVYAARDLKLDREVALKLMRLDRGAAQLGGKMPEVFEREARATARLNHSNIVTLYQFGNWNGLLYLVLERLRGETLNARLERGAVSLADGVAIMEQVARALVHTHAAGITHRDLKPQNVYLLAGGGVKVLDFGVSGLTRGADAPPGARGGGGRSTLSLAGTPGYMAPEQWAGRPQDARTDIWAVGVMLYQIVTGELPFGVGSIDGSAHMPALEDRLPEEARDLARLIASCLVAQHDMRLGSAAELAERLHEIAAKLGALTVPSAATSTTAIATARVRARRQKRGAIAAAVLAVTAATITGAAMRHSSGDRCSDASGPIARVWNGAARQQLSRRLGATATWSEIARTLDTYAGQWGPLRAGACQSESRAAAACLDDHLRTFAQLVTDLGTMDLGSALGASRALPPLSDCSDPEYIAALEHPDTATARDPAASVPYALVIAGRGRDIIHAAAFVENDVVIAALVTPGTTLAGTKLPPPRAGAASAVIARIRADGTVRWKQMLDNASALSLATSGDSVVVGGTYNANAAIGNVAFAQVPGATDGFVASFDAATGDLRWMHVVGASQEGVTRAIAADGDGNVYAAGDFSGTARFGGARVYDAAGKPETAPWVASWAKDGQLRWVQAARGTSGSRTWSIVSARDAVVFASWVRGSGVLGDRALGAGSCVIGRLAPDTGAIRWLHFERGANGRCVVDSLAVQGERIAAGGRHYHATNGGWLAELAFADGTVKWIDQLGTSDATVPKSLAFAADGSLIAAGHYADEMLQLGDIALVSNGSWDAFVARYDQTGRCVAAIGFGGATADLARWVGSAPDGRLLVAGRFETAMQIGNRNLRGSGLFDGYLIELSPELMRPRPRAASASP